MMTEKQAVCPYCGKQRFVNVPVETTEEELTKLAADACDCEQASVTRGLVQTNRAIEMLLGEESKTKGFDYEVAEATSFDIREICIGILHGNLNRVTLVEPNGDVIKLAKNGNAVKIQRTSKRQLTI